MSVWNFARSTLLDPSSPACAWRRPVQAARVVAGAAGNAVLAAAERVLPGGSRACPICGWRGRQFRTFLSADEVIPRCICPGCGSFDRHRLLALGLRRELGRAGRPRGPLLAFAQSDDLHDFLAREGIGRCFRVDYTRGPFTIDFLTDLRAAGVADGAVDWLLCSHVLEHIAEFDACLDEIARIVRPGGLAWIQVPQEPGLAISRRIPIDPHRAHAHAWQFGADFAARLARPAWSVTEIGTADLTTPAQARAWGIVADERYWRLQRLP